MIPSGRVMFGSIICAVTFLTLSHCTLPPPWNPPPSGTTTPSAHETFGYAVPEAEDVGSCEISAGIGSKRSQTAAATRTFFSTLCLKGRAT